MKIVYTVEQFIKKNRLLTPGDKVLVTLSGGSDSVALLLILKNLGYQCIAAHCNFSLRGEESDRDELFVRNLCRQNSIPLQVTRFDTKQYASGHHLSIEMAARELRYEWFEKLRKEQNTKAIAVAHHRDDSVETMLLNLIRGTGIHGLCGIRPRNGYIVRPLLCISRKDIIDYLSHIRQDYVTDSTNLMDEFTRNKIRLRLLPLMEEINPSVKESLQRTADHINEATLIYDNDIKAAQERVLVNDSIDIAALMRETSPIALLFELLSPIGFNSTQINDIFESLEGQSGKIFYSNTHTVIKDRTKLHIAKTTKEKGDNPNPPFELEYKEVPYTPDYVIPRSSHKVCFDADKIKQPFCIRKYQTGDRFVPFGMKGTKLVSDFLTDLKCSIIDKQNQWVLCSENNIAWVIGKRTDNRYKIDKSTKKVLEIMMKEKSKK